jgi:hypothetical protein
MKFVASRANVHYGMVKRFLPSFAVHENLLPTRLRFLLYLPYRASGGCGEKFSFCWTKLYIQWTRIGYREFLSAQVFVSMGLHGSLHGKASNRAIAGGVGSE